MDGTCLRGAGAAQLCIRQTESCVSPTCPIKCAVLVGVQSDHLTDGPHIVPQHDALCLHHEEVGVGWWGQQREMVREQGQ